MKTSSFLQRKVLFPTIGLGILFFAIHAAAIEFTPDHLVSKGGVFYYKGGDSTETIFNTPPNVKDFLEPGILIGVLPQDCIPVSSGSLGEHFNCDYGLILKPEEKYGQTVYRVIELR